MGIGALIVPGTVRDSLFILDALLNLDGGVKPEMIATDHASYSDAVFGLFTMLGYRFAPRFRDLPTSDSGARTSRMGRPATTGRWNRSPATA